MMPLFSHAMRRRCALTTAVGGIALAWTVLAIACYGQPVAPPAINAQGNVQNSLTSGYGPRGWVSYLANFNGQTVTIPASLKGPGYSRQSGFQLSFHTDWPGQYGYRPVVFTLSRANPSASEQRIRIRFNAGDYQSQGKGIEVEDSFVFPQGATTASFTLLAPQYQDWYMFGWRIWVDGRPDDYLGVDVSGGVQIGPNSTNMGVLLTGTTPAETAAYQSTLQSAYSGMAVSTKALALTELPTDWLRYTAIDIVVIPADRLLTLISSHPQQAEGLLRWVRAGGNLWITEARDNWSLLPEVDTAIDTFTLTATNDRQGAHAAVGTQGSVDEWLAKRGWRHPPTNERSGDATEAALVLSGFEVESGAPSSHATPQSPGAQFRESPLADVTRQFLANRQKAGGWASSSWAESLRRHLAPPRGKRFIVRGYGFGALVAMRSGLGFVFNPAGNPLFTEMNQTLIQPRVSWASRHGNQPNSYNIDFNKLLIPGVGVAPVGMFQVLITLFVVGIGPLNYWLLRRRNKLPMLLFTAPAAAVATTALLFAYGLFADGFGVQTRARTLTLLDQRSGEATSWGRLSYYAGVAPAGGLTIPSDQAMYPMNPEWAVGYRAWAGGSMRPQRELLWGDERQRLAKGWLQSRTPTQYLAIAARPSSKRLELRVAEQGLRVINRLGVDVTHLAVEDHQGRVYWCENLAVDQGAVIPVTDRDKVKGEIRRLFIDNVPEAPVGADNGYSGQVYDFVASQSILEGRLGAINGEVTSWGRGKYIAFTAEPVELSLGVDSADQQASFHVVEGTW